jgi:general secretion pathway protein A
MYTDFFGLQKLPFNLTPDPAFLFLPSKHREALAGLTYAILERKGFAVLTGDAGTGKTTLINSVFSRLPDDRLESSVMLNPTLTASEFLESVLLDFDIRDIPASKAQRLWKLQEFLGRIHEQKRLAVLVIDEAHKLSLDVLEEIRLLGNFESAADKFLQILLVGQSELDDLLNRQDLRQFKQRISLRLYIDRLTATEAQQYIRFRWAKAGAKEAPPFTEDALGGVLEWSQGVPRLINSICDTALLMAYGDECPLIGLKHVRNAAINLALVDAPVRVGSLPPATNGPVEKPHVFAKPGVPKVEQPSFEDWPNDIVAVPTLAGYGDPRGNSTLFKRLAEKFGLS